MAVVKNTKIVVESSRFYKDLRGIGVWKNHKKTPKTIKMCSKCAQKIQFVSKNAKKSRKIKFFPMGTLTQRNNIGGFA